MITSAGRPRVSLVADADIQVEGHKGTSDPPVADFSYTSDLTDGGYKVHFTDQSYGGYDSESYERKWQFGDGVTSELKNPTHEYGTLDDFQVMLTVTPTRCVPKSVTKTVSIPVGGTTTPSSPPRTLAPLAGLILLRLAGGAFVWRRATAHG